MTTYIWYAKVRSVGGVLAAVALASCQPEADRGCEGEYCGTLVFAAPGEPSALLPVLSDEALDRDIFDQVYLKLADVGPTASTTSVEEFEPLLAHRWEWSDSLTLVFHLDPRARWHDGSPVQADDVAFTYSAYTDTLIDSPFRGVLAHVVAVEAADSLRAVFRFDHVYPEMLFDAVYHMRILPQHLLAGIARDAWSTAPLSRAPIGNGPYRFVSWTAGQSVELVADSTFFLGRPHIRRLVWRFTPDLTVAVTQVVAGEADAIQVLVTPPNIERATAAPQIALYEYAGSVYNVLGFNLRANGDRARPHPVLGEVAVRRALVLATDRVRLATSVFGSHAKVPPGPISQLWRELWFDSLVVPPYDPARAAALLDTAGWKIGPDGIRARAGTPLAFSVAVPSSSGSRKQYAQLLQEQLRNIGVTVTIDLMEGATMQERQRSGAYDAIMEAWSTDPSPSSVLRDAWTQEGEANFGGYANPVFDGHVRRATTASDAAVASLAWRDALAVLADDAPAMVLYALDNIAAVDRRVTNVRIRPDYWWAYVRHWKIPPDKLTARDRAVR